MLVEEKYSNKSQATSQREESNSGRTGRMLRGITAYSQQMGKQSLYA